MIVRLEEEADIACVLDRDAHLRLRALIVDLSLYKVRWEVKQNKWKLGGEVVEFPRD